MAVIASDCETLAVDKRESTNGLTETPAGEEMDADTVQWLLYRSALDEPAVEIGAHG